MRQQLNVTREVISQSTFRGHRKDSDDGKNGETMANAVRFGTGPSSTTPRVLCGWDLQLTPNDFS